MCPKRMGINPRPSGLHKSRPYKLRNNLLTSQGGSLLIDCTMEIVNTENDMAQFMGNELLCSACAIDLCPREKVINLACEPH